MYRVSLGCVKVVIGGTFHYHQVISVTIDLDILSIPRLFIRIDRHCDNIISLVSVGSVSPDSEGGEVNCRETEL